MLREENRIEDQAFSGRSAFEQKHGPETGLLKLCPGELARFDCAYFLQELRHAWIAGDHAAMHSQGRFDISFAGGEAFSHGRGGADQKQKPVWRFIQKTAVKFDTTTTKLFWANLF